MMNNSDRMIFVFDRIRCGDIDEGREVEKLLLEAGYHWPEEMWSGPEVGHSRAALLCYPCVISLHGDGSLSWGKHFMEIPDIAVGLQDLRRAMRDGPTFSDDFKKAAESLGRADISDALLTYAEHVATGSPFQPLHVLKPNPEDRFIPQPDGSIKLGTLPAGATIRSLDDSLAYETCTMSLPVDSAERKEYPLFSGLLKYFPAALAGVAHHSKEGNDKHNPGQPLHHSRGKSTDHADCIVRHLVDLSDLLVKVEADDSWSDDLMEEASALCWRALALSQELHEKYDGAPLAPGAKL